jgi:hypothetical protein
MRILRFQIGLDMRTIIDCQAVTSIPNLAQRCIALETLSADWLAASYIQRPP